MATNFSKINFELVEFGKLLNFLQIALLTHVKSLLVLPFVGKGAKVLPAERVAVSNVLRGFDGRTFGASTGSCSGSFLGYSEYFECFGEFLAVLSEK